MKILSSKMRDIQQLLLADAGPDRIADYNFRSREEVETYIRGLEQQVQKTTDEMTRLEKLFARTSETAEKFTIDRYGSGKNQIKLPPGHTEPIQGIDRDKLKSNYALLADLQHKLEVLQSLEVTVSHNFRTERTTLTKQVKTLRAKLETQRDRALAVLEKMAKNKEPTLLKTVVKQAVVGFRQNMKGKFKDCTEFTYVTTWSENGFEHLLFNHYVHVTKLQNDVQDFVYPDYYLVFSAVVTEKGRMNMFVNTLHEFRAPGSFTLGEQFDGDAYAPALNSMLSADQFVDALDRPQIPLKTQQIKLKNFEVPIKTAEVVNNRIVITLPAISNKAELDNAVDSVAKDVRGMLLPHGIDNAVLKHKVISVGRNRYQLEFIIVPPKGKPIGLDANHEHVLRERMGMTDEQIRAVRKIMTKGYA